MARAVILVKQWHDNPKVNKVFGGILKILLNFLSSKKAKITSTVEKS